MIKYVYIVISEETAGLQRRGVKSQGRWEGPSGPPRPSSLLGPPFPGTCSAHDRGLAGPGAVLRDAGPCSAWPGLRRRKSGSNPRWAQRTRGGTRGRRRAGGESEEGRLGLTRGAGHAEVGAASPVTPSPPAHRAPTGRTKPGGRRGAWNAERPHRPSPGSWPHRRARWEIRHPGDPGLGGLRPAPWERVGGQGAGSAHGTEVTGGRGRAAPCQPTPPSPLGRPEVDRPSLFPRQFRLTTAIFRGRDEGPGNDSGKARWSVGGEALFRKAPQMPFQRKTCAAFPTGTGSA